MRDERVEAFASLLWPGVHRYSYVARATTPGTFVLVSLGLGWYVSPWFLLFTAFVGLNLFQSAFTKWCPLMTILRGLGMSDPDQVARGAR